MLTLVLLTLQGSILGRLMLQFLFNQFCCSSQHAT
ncbi:hypothetical protein SLEP1_g37214 [Rubroshorea leprosula]|uniref:Uncharacterized protein n=1 Tax=Rubroshorea leprosula TaxID=152421 RepID=A0AAV5KTV7_9ROSI|nr:hypothetical protein SLEP1_g37214 [Rubroshorea leprosula]